MWRFKFSWNPPDTYTNLFLGVGLAIGKYEYGIVLCNLFIGFTKEYCWID